jgi:hypothetical protein
LSACQALPLATWDFYFQNCSSPFLAWANTPTPHYKLGVLVLIEGANPTSMFTPNICHEFIPIGGINIPTFVWLDAGSKVQVPSYNISLFFECMSFHLWEWHWFWLCELFVHSFTFDCMAFLSCQ